MKNVIKKSYLVATILLATIVSCNNDDSAPITPINLQNLEVTIDENPTSGQVVGSVQSNSSNALTYSIATQTPAGALSINASTGELTVLDEMLFDFEANPTITATITATGASNLATVTVNINDKHEIGEFKFGGIIFWVNNTGTEGYVMSMNDQSSAAPYGCMHTVTGATGVNIGSGAVNTTAILTICSATGTAADLVSNLNSNGFNDWFLPSQNEFKEISDNMAFLNTALSNNGGSMLSTWGSYWTSTEANAAEAVHYNLSGNWFPTDYKSNTHPVRAVRRWTDF
jgi:hypothetical protein